MATHKASNIYPQLIPILPIQKNEPGPSAIVNKACTPEQQSNPVPPPAWSQQPGPYYWPPHFMSTSSSNPRPNDPTLPFSYYPPFMPQWGGQPGWVPPIVPVGQQPLQLPEYPVQGFHPPGRAVGLAMPIPSPFPPSQVIDPHLYPPADQPLQLPANVVHGFHDPSRPVGPGMPVPPPFSPPSQAIDPHPLPSGEPPFAFMYSPVSLDKKPIDHSVTTPTKKLPPKTPRKTPGKRKREEAEVTPSNKPTRASNRTRTPKKIFEIA